MPKLYFSASGQGKATFMVAHIIGAQVDSEKVDLDNLLTASGKDYRSINPRGNAPCIVLDDGVVINEGSAILQAVADMKPGAIAPENETSLRYRLQSYLNFIAMELHTNFIILRKADLHANMLPAGVREYALGAIREKYKYIDANWVKGKKFVVGDRLSIADLYLWNMASWMRPFHIDMAPFSELRRYLSDISGLEEVIAAEEAWAELAGAGEVVSPHFQDNDE